MDDYYQNIENVILELFAFSKTYKDVIIELNRRGIKTVSGKEFSPSSLLILRKKLGLNIEKKKPLSLKYYVYKITCNYPYKCQGFVYYGKHKDRYPHSNTYMGGGDLLVFAQKKFGLEYFEKSVIAIFDSSEESEKLEREIVSKDFISRSDNFNMSLGGKNSRLTQYAHPLKHRIIEYIRDKEIASWENQKVWEYRRGLAQAMKGIFLTSNIGQGID